MALRPVRVYAPVYVGDLETSSVAVQNYFGRVPTYSGFRFYRGLLTVAVLVGVLALAVVSALHNHSRILFVIEIACAIWAAWKIWRLGEYPMRREMGIRDAELLGPPAEGEVYVGVSYCHGAWSYRGEFSWDRGYLRIDRGVLTFRGFGPSFELHQDRISRVEVGQVAFSGLPLIRVYWTSEEGRQNRLNLEVRTAKSLEAALAASEALAKQICQTEPVSTLPQNENAEPFESSRLEFAHTPAQALTLMDLLVSNGAGLVVISTAAGLLVMVNLLLRANWLSAAFFVLPIAPLGQITRWVLRERLAKRADPQFASETLRRARV